MDKINMINKMRVEENEAIDNSTSTPTSSAGQKCQPLRETNDVRPIRRHRDPTPGSISSILLILNILSNLLVNLANAVHCEKVPKKGTGWTRLT